MEALEGYLEGPEGSKEETSKVVALLLEVLLRYLPRSQSLRPPKCFCRTVASDSFWGTCNRCAPRSLLTPLLST